MLWVRIRPCARFFTAQFVPNPDPLHVYDKSPLLLMAWTQENKLYSFKESDDTSEQNHNLTDIREKYEPNDQVSLKVPRVNEPAWSNAQTEQFVKSTNTDDANYTFVFKKMVPRDSDVFWNLNRAKKCYLFI